MKLFISYSRDDKNYTYELAQLLRDDADFDIWIDRRLVGADLWWDTILDEIEKCECFVFVITPASVASIFCLTELEYALALQKPVVPLMLKRAEVPEPLKQIQYIDIESSSLYKALFLCSRAVSKVEKRLLLGKYDDPKTAPSRPVLPQPDQDQPEHVYEVFALAEEAAAGQNLPLAQQLYERVIAADPDGLGIAAKDRLEQLTQSHERDMAYEAVRRLANNPLTLEGARAAWQVFMRKFGAYDPDNLTAVLQPVSDLAVAASAMSPVVMMTPISPVPIRYDNEVPPPLLPSPFEWCAIPAGEVVLEDATKRIPPGSAGGRSHVGAFYIAKYPITNLQYQFFIAADDGYCDPHWWDFSMQAWEWRERTPHPKETGFPGDDLPRTCVNWYDAVAYCRWLSAQVDYEIDITLPTEAQWQRAAQGDDHRAYPWGHEFDEKRCNIKASKRHGVTQVTAYPKGASPYGVMDMAGNVREWCLTQWTNEQNDLDGDDLRVLRSGSIYGSARKARVTYRYSNRPDLRLSSFGFRIAFTLDS